MTVLLLVVDDCLLVMTAVRIVLPRPPSRLGVVSVYEGGAELTARELPQRGPVGEADRLAVLVLHSFAVTGLLEDIGQQEPDAGRPGFGPRQLLQVRRRLRQAPLLQQEPGQGHLVARRIGAAAHGLLELAERPRGVTDASIGLAQAVVEPGIVRVQVHGFLEMTQRGLASSDPRIGEAEIVMRPRIARR